jgi:integrative and conjugative element protein (TIGR02256 family)
VSNVRVIAPAAATIAREAAASVDGLETGGILLGFDESDLGELLVLEAGDPGPNAERRADFFQRDLEHARRLADDAYAQTTARWVGEWHTHPRGHLVPSRVDLKTYRGFLRNPQLEFAMFLAIIVGPGDDGWNRPRAAAWLIEQRRLFPAFLLPTAAPLELTYDVEGGAEEKP